MKIVGLNIEKGRLAVAVVERGLHQNDLKDSFSSTFATDAELIDILKEKARDWAGARIVSSIPGHYFSQRLVHFPFADRTDPRSALKLYCAENGIPLQCFIEVTEACNLKCSHCYIPEKVPHNQLSTVEYKHLFSELRDLG